LRALEGTEQEPSPHPAAAAAALGTGRPPLIILASSIKLLKFHGDINAIAKRNFEFRTSRNDTRVVRQEMADYSAIILNLMCKICNVSPSTLKPRNSRPSSGIFPVPRLRRDILNELVALRFSAISVHQMTATTHGGRQSVSQPLFL
jgi:hypothetical protein